jgi:hypothetical protein
MSRYDMLIRKLNFEGRVGHCFHNHTLKFNHVILRQNNPSIPSDSCCQSYTSVSTMTPSDVMATVFS